MKAKVPLLLMTFLMCFGCQTNDDLEIENPSKSTTEIPTHFESKTAAPSSLHRNNLQWASFLTARAILNSLDTNVEIQFTDQLTGDNTINLEDLLNNPASSDFKDVFKGEFLYFRKGGAIYCGRPSGSLNPPNPPGGCGSPQACDNFAFNNYVDYLILEHCTEFYLPNGYNAIIDSLNSSAHPLSTNNFNTRFEHPECANIGGDLVVNVINVSTLPNLIVARPFRDPFTGCDYNEYSNIIFTAFLGN